MATLLSPLPTPPDPDNPSTFDTLAYPFCVAERNMVTELNALMPSIAAKLWATVGAGSTANALVLSCGFPALAVGTQIRFRAPGANTGAATINLDGLGAKACRTVTGVALPAGYIRTDADTLATYDGTYWVLDRAPEMGSNSNGRYLRLANGYQSCSKSLPAAFISTTSIRASWTYPAAFATASGPKITATPDLYSASGYADSTSTRHYLGACGCVNITESGVFVDQYKSFGAPDIPSSATITISAMATGVWY